MLVFSAVTYESSQRQENLQIDESLFARIGIGEKNAFCELYQITNNAIFSFALSLLHNQQDAEDAVQETYIKIRSAAHLYTPMGKPLAWIFTITRNVCLMKLRTQKHYAAMPFDDIKDKPDCSGIQDREDRIVLETACQVLSSDEIQIIVLHAVSGMKHREISELLHLPLSTVLSKYNRALKKLRSELENLL